MIPTMEEQLVDRALVSKLLPDRSLSCSVAAKHLWLEAAAKGPG